MSESSKAWAAYYKYDRERKGINPFILRRLQALHQIAREAEKREAKEWASKQCGENK